MQHTQTQEMSNLPPGYRFYPTEEELVGFYLRNKLENTRNYMERVIPVLHVYAYDPWQLPQFSGEPCVRDTEQWFFFCPRQQREAHGGRPTRTTPAGYWKATGSPGFVYSSANRVIGMKKTMVFYTGRAPNGSKTQWKMNEYRAVVNDATPTPGAAPQLRREFSLCRVYMKSGCLRAFDRRPSVATTSESQITQEASVSAANPSMATRTSSQDSSSSDENGSHHAAAGGATDWNMLGDINWDSLDWD